MQLIHRYFISLLILLTILVSGCDKNTENASESRKDTVKTKDSTSGKLFSGSPDLPKDSFQITSAGMGKILLGDSLEKLCQVYNCSSSQAVTIWEEGKEWPAQKVMIGKHYFLLAEMINTVNLISKLTTNDPGFKTHNGIHAGMPLDSLISSEDSLQVDFGHKSFSYGKSGVWFKIDAKTASKYFSKKDPSLSFLKGGKIEEVFILCADC